MSKRRSRRLLKKLHLGEFREMGFCFEAKLKRDTNEDALMDAFLMEAVAPAGLSFGGWITGGAIEKLGRGSVTEEARQQTLVWLKARPEVETLTASGLIDMWYSDGEAVALTAA